MKFEQNNSMLFSDVNIPEVFITEYLSDASGDYIKIYLYCLFLCKYNCEISTLDLSKKLSLPIKTVEEGLKYWEKQGIIIKKNKVYEIADVKKIEFNKLYVPKVTSSPEDAIESNNKNIHRTQAINDINSTFFQGVMSPIWYTDIDNIFKKYQFDEDVVIALFRYCFDKQALHKNYVQAVAEGWFNNKIKTMSDLEKYYIEAENLNKIKKTISKKLGITRNLTEFEEGYIKKWIDDYSYSMDIIELALKKTTSKTNFSFDYIDKIISDWHEKKLDSVDTINTYIKEQKQKNKEIKAMQAKLIPDQISFNKYFDQDNSQYDDMSKYYANL